MTGAPHTCGTLFGEFSGGRRRVTFWPGGLKLPVTS